MGKVVCNVQSAINIANAVKGSPVTHRTLTVTGQVAHPATIQVPIGTTFYDLLRLSGNEAVEEMVYIEGGPIMGSILSSLQSPVTKTTGGIVALPKNHPLIQIKTQPMDQILRIAKMVCEQCQLCTDLCPRNIIGHRDLKPHMTIRSVNYKNISDSITIKGAALCSDCGVCELYSCPVNISPRRVNQAIKKELAANGIRYEGTLSTEDPVWEARLVPSKRLANRIGLKKYYYQEAPMEKLDLKVNTVFVPLRQHVGFPCIPSVCVGDCVSIGQPIGWPEANKLGAPIHASIDGIVKEITESCVVIESRRER